MISKKKQILKIKSNWISNKIFSGNFLSKFFGQSLEIKELREYDYSDDYRTIDWNTTARMNKPFVKVNEIERSNDIVLLIDISKSIESFFDEKISKKKLIAEISFLLIHSLIKNQDRIGAIFFSDIIEKVIPLTKNKNVLPMIMEYLHTYKPQNRGTNFSNCLEYSINLFPQKTILIIFSDFYFVDDFEKILSITSKKFKIISIKIADNNADLMIEKGIIRVFDGEKEEKKIISLNSKMKKEIKEKSIKSNLFIKKYVRNFIEITNYQRLYSQLENLFKNLK